MITINVNGKFHSKVKHYDKVEYVLDSLKDSGILILEKKEKWSDVLQGIGTINIKTVKKSKESYGNEDTSLRTV